MSIPGKLLIALLSALAVSIAFGFINPQLSLALLFAPTAAAAVLAVVLSHRALPMPSGLASDGNAASVPDSGAETPERQPTKRTASGRAGGPGGRQADKSPGKKPKRAAAEKTDSRKPQSAQPKGDAGPGETGTVKWFNASKGFGFIIRENGEEIFVHHRSILGDGRRSLRDGAAVSFHVVTTDKGPQAEDVSALD